MCMLVVLETEYAVIMSYKRQKPFIYMVSEVLNVTQTSPAVT